MRLKWTQDQQERAKQFETIAQQHVLPNTSKHYAAGSLDVASWKALADAGLWRIPVPANLGGDGKSWWDFCSAFEGVARGSRDLGFCLSLIAHAGLLRSVLLYGSENLHSTIVPKLISGSIGATALTELAGGSDVARVQTRATYTDDHLTLTGEKAHITNAPVADIFWVLGRLDGLPPKRDITVFLVDREDGGVTTGHPEAMFGNRTSPTGSIRFDSVSLAADRVLGDAGDGLSLTYDTIALDRILYGIVSAAYLEHLLDDALLFVHERLAFGHPIADHQYVQRRITNIKLAIETSRWVSYAALDRLIDRDPETSMMSSTAKLLGSEALSSAAIDLMQLYGHTGYEVGVHTRNVQDSLGTLIAGGTSDIQRKNIFTQMISVRSARPQDHPVTAVA